MADVNHQPAPERGYSVEAAAIAGLVFAGLYAAAQVILIRAPPLLAPPEKVIEWYEIGRASCRERV